MNRKFDLEISKKKNNNRFGNLIWKPVKSNLTAFLLFSMIFIGFSFSGQAAAQDLQAQNQSRQSEGNASVTSNGRSARVLTASYADLVEKVTPAVVTVRSEVKTMTKVQELPYGNDPMLREFFGKQLPQMQQQQPRIERGLGSGVIVKSNGIILTNNHVVNGASSVKVDLPDKRTFEAKVIGTDPPSDLAVLKIEAADLPTLTLGNSDDVRVGDVVLAIGNPLGLRQTVTGGIISAKGRQTGISDGSFEDFLQTDAPINQGNSGGALVDLNGELIGINSQILSTSGGSIGLGFSIPSNMAKTVMAQLIKDGKVRRGMIGVGIQDVNSDLAENFGLKEVRGVIVNSVSPNSPAEKAGIKQGDVILNINDVIINDGNELRNRVAQTAPETEITVGISRGGNQQSVKVKLSELQPKNTASKNGTENSNAEPIQGKLGMSLTPLTPQTARQFNLTDAPKSGLLVTEVQPGSPADEAGIEQSDIILQVNRQVVKTTEQVKMAATAAKGNSVLLLIDRNGQNLFISVKL